MEQVSDGTAASVSAPLAVKDLSFSYPDAAEHLFANVNLDVHHSEIVSIIGLSGSGKTTLCHCMSGIIPLVKGGDMRGEVLINSQSTRELTLPQVATSLGIVFQEPDTQLFFPKVEDEIAFGPENLCVPSDEIPRIIDNVLWMVGMEQFKEHNPHHLSGGQKQLIAVACVLSLDPDVLIFDEATSQLDSQGTETIMDLMVSLRESGKAIVTVEHDPENLEIADRVKLLRAGSLVDFDGDWEIFESLDG